MKLPPSPLAFFEHLVWLDGRPLLDTIERYRRQTFEDVFLTFDPDGRRRYNTALIGRAKKNYKTSDLGLAALYCLLAVESKHGNDCFIVANDEDQADDDLTLIKKLIAVNPILANEVQVLSKEIARLDGRGSLRILPARDVVGMHGKTYLCLGIDEMHGYRDYGVLEGLAPDPSRLDSMIWITTYASVYHTQGAPLHDYFKRGQAGEDPRMYFSWYSGDYCTDPDFAELPPEERANPSMASWGNPEYIEQQRRRLPAHKFRRLHLNLPGMPDGAYFDPGKLQDAILAGQRHVPPQANVRYRAFFDGSGGSQDDAALAIAHHDGRRVILDVIATQTRRPPFDPREAIEKFAGLLSRYDCHAVTGDRYAGETFRFDFSRFGIAYHVCGQTKHELYEEFEPILNAGEVQLLDEPRLVEQFLGLVVRGTKIDHMSGEHDDLANACAGAVWLASKNPVARAMQRRRLRPMRVVTEYDELSGS